MTELTTGVRLELKVNSRRCSVDQIVLMSEEDMLQCDEPSFREWAHARLDEMLVQLGAT